MAWYLFSEAKLKHSFAKILAFHDIADGFDYSISRISLRRFGEIIEFLSARSFRGTTLSGRTESRDVALTFDDGLQSVFVNAGPILKEYGHTATVFVVVGYVGKKSSWDYRPRMHLTWSEIKGLSDMGFEIGSHSLSHRDLRLLNDATLEREVVDSRKIIEDHLGLPVRYFSYPFGRFDSRVIEAVRRAGYHNGYALATGDRELAVLRRGVYAYDTPYSVYLKLEKESWIEATKDYINNALAGGTIAMRRLFPPGERQ